MNQLDTFTISPFEIITPSKDNPYKLFVPKASKAVADISFLVDDSLLISSRFENTLKFYFAPTADTLPAGTVYEILSSSDQEVDCNIAGSPENKFLIFINNTDMDGEVEIWFI